MMLNLEQSRRLAALGMPQDGWPQMVWVEGPEYFKPSLEWWGHDHGWISDQYRWYAATDYFTAFEFMASLGWTFDWRSDADGTKWCAWFPDSVGKTQYADTPSTLLDGILTAQEGA